MRKKFADLKARMSPGVRGRVEARTKDMIAEMLLTEVRQLVGLTQEELAKKLGINIQPASREYFIEPFQDTAAE